MPLYFDSVKDGPIICVGLASLSQIAMEVFAEFSAHAKTLPRAIAFFSDDPICQYADMQSYVPEGVPLVKIHAGLVELKEAVGKASSTLYSLPLPFDSSGTTSYGSLSKYSDVATVVNHKLVTTVSKGEHNLLTDILFQPAVPKWDPFMHAMDFQRTSTTTLLNGVKDLVQSKRFASSSVVIEGGAGTGKTTAAKRVAYDLAKLGYLTVWIRTSLSQDTPRRIHEFLGAIKDEGQASGPVIIFLDDPFELNTISAKDIVSAANAHRLRILLVITGRSSDWHTYTDYTDVSGGLPVNEIHKVPDDLDEDEVSRLAEYLVLLDIASDNDDGVRQVESARSKYARDIFGLLYFLLPRTRASLEQAVTGEYFRLGERPAFDEVVKDAAMGAGGHLRKAYEYVAVADHLKTPLPTEVLVSALDISYGEWVLAFQPDEPIAGLLYAEVNEEAETVCYRTRNALVSDIIVKAVNGGSLGTAGEFRILRDLLSACGGAAPAYHYFAQGVLIPYKKMQRYEHEQGVQLYDAALLALPAQDRAIMHHKGIYVHKVGHNPEEAYRILGQALDVPNYPYETKVEIDEHIHTSSAACILSQLKSGVIDREEGKKRIVEHLNNAQSASFISARAVHVQGRFIAECLTEFDHESDRVDSLGLAAKALADVDRTLIMLETDSRMHEDIATDRSYLEQVREEVLDSMPVEAAPLTEAMELWEKYGRQDGIVLAARRMYGIAQKRNKGKDFSEAYNMCQKAIATIHDRDEVPVCGLYEVMMHIYYHWRVRRGIYHEGAEPIDWEQMERMGKEVLRSGDVHVQAFNEYLVGLALAHQMLWSEAHVYFKKIRDRRLPSRVAAEPRDLLLNENGGARLIQGVVKSGVGRRYLWVSELDHDFIIFNPNGWPEEGLSTHGYIEFSFNGPRAIKDLSLE
ncbi:hypothetical protein ACERK3_13725 [Phycisphaerales bacterium AB-hyl4]|uniref:Novel STAND NTPase 5 domain-containing protein n=1 Tax=Natronomicrosphaera hydrolytica TaxID=3242702 RepID=A0ABV4U6X8_9BACT